MSLIPVSATRNLARTVLRAKKNSPHIFFAAGLVGMATTVVLACRATLKLEKSLDEIKTDFMSVKGLKEESTKDGRPYTEQDYYKDLAYVYSKSIRRITILYAPSIGIGAVSIAALTGSHVQLARRNTALTVTLAAVSKAYDEYRIRVRNEIGEERELEIFRGIREREIEIDGKKELVKVSDPNEWSIYTREFDESNPHFQNSQELNRLHIQTAQNYANHMLHARGHYFLNDAYDSLGIERSTPGAIVGWILKDGSGYVDFGLHDPTNYPTPLFDIRRSFILDFNVDGVIYKMIEEKP